MFCPECGNNLPDGSAFCSNCGKQLMEQPQYEQPVYQPQPEPQYQPQPEPQYQPQPEPQYQPQPVYQPQPESQYQPQPVYQPQPEPRYPRPTIDPEAMSKREFIKECGDKKVKSTSLMVTVTMLVVLALIAGSILVMLNTPVYEIPVINNAIDAINDLGGENINVSKLKTEMERGLRSLRSEYMYIRGEMTVREQQATETVLDAVEKAANNLSILALRNCARELEEVGNFTSTLKMPIVETLKGIGKAIEIIAGILIGCFFLPLLFVLLGGFRKSTGLSVAALIFTVIAQLTWTGWIWAVITGAVLLAQCILCSNITKAQMAYRWSFRN